MMVSSVVCLCLQIVTQEIFGSISFDSVGVVLKVHACCFLRVLNHVSSTLKICISLVSVSKNFWFTYVVKMFESSTPWFSLFFFKLFLWQMWMLNLKLLEKFHLELYLPKYRFMYLNCWLTKLSYLWLKSDSLIW